MTLTAEDLTFRYQKSGRELLGHFSLTLEPGEVVGLSAPSGRGKTTLCKVLAGYEHPRSGAVLLDGQPLSQFSGPCPVQLIWQHPEQAVNPRFTMAAVLREGGTVDPRVAEGLQLRPDWLTRYPAELSGGELQRFCIARALGADPRFLLCDEMTAMLDLITQSQIWSFLLEEARRRQLGLLVVSHSQALLDRICTRRITMD